MSMVGRFLADESGVSSVKYGLVVASISLALVVVLQGVGGKVRDALAAVDAPEIGSLRDR
ncbi:MAG TPA: Flp family type IVb pilin [Xanthobacteraceae bacterium]|nr:Flp family type IVb pilin [Xanthobacteraceae bacterium]